MLKKKYSKSKRLLSVEQGKQKEEVLFHFKNVGSL